MFETGKAAPVQNIKIPTSVFNQNSTEITTMRTGELTPVYLAEVLPGDIFDMKINCVVRTLTPITAVMDNSYLDIDFYFVPWRIVWNQLKEFFGENTKDEWELVGEYTLPQIEIPANGFSVGTVADHLGLPIDMGAGEQIVHLPFRAYVQIFNDWYRNQNTQKPALNVFDSAKNLGIRYADDTAYENADGIADAIKGGKLLKGNKIRDYFTEALPAPQKGTQVGLAVLGHAPIITSTQEYDLSPDAPKMLWNDIKSGRPLDGNLTESVPDGGLGYRMKPDGKNVTFIKQSGSLVEIAPRNLFADLSQAGAIEINEFRKKLAEQQVLELMARAGTRYNEIILSAYGVQAADARLDRAEYLGGENISIEQGQVAQTSATETPGTPGATAQTPQGNIAAYSLTGLQGVTPVVNKGFQEHGYIMGVAIHRTAQTYSQGIDKMWSRKTRNDIYQPLFSNLGEQPILNKEIFASANAAENEKVFGYAEYGAEYRYKQNKATGLMRPNVKGNIAYKHYGVQFDAIPTLNHKFTEQSEKEMRRSLAVQTGPELEVNIYFMNKLTRRMPIRAIPAGLERLI